jgi:ATP synthase subunit 6
MFTPLAQFDIYIVWVWNLSVLNYLIYLNNLNVVVFSLYSFFFLTFFFFIEEIKMLPNKIQYLFEKVYLFLYWLVFQQVGQKGMKYFPLLSSIFIMIILLNIIGLLPWSFAVTSHFIFSIYMSLSTCLGIFFLGLLNYKLNYFKIFLQDIPILLYPLMTIIELASYVIRAFSLAIRLSANIMAGHILVDIIAEVVAFLNYCFFDLSFLGFLLLMALFFLEIGVACLQAYVFVLLITIYLNDAVNLNLHVESHN